MSVRGVFKPTYGIQTHLFEFHSHCLNHLTVGTLNLRFPCILVNGRSKLIILTYPVGDGYTHRGPLDFHGSGSSSGPVSAKFYSHGDENMPRGRFLPEGPL